MVKIVVEGDASGAAARAAALVADHLGAHPRPVLGLATGETMRPLYRHLVALHRAGRADFAHATTFNLDEYLGVGADHPAGFAAFMRACLFDHVNLDPARTHLPRGAAPDPCAEAARYEAQIAQAGGIGLQLLGLGQNGHIGFNEPGSDFASVSRVVTLTEATRQANARAWAPAPVPLRAITMGIATILAAQSCVMLATGAAKAPALARMTGGAIAEGCPASALRLHPDMTLILDAEAARGLAAA